MSQYKNDVAAGDTVYFWFAANTTTGTAGDGATPLYDVRLAGASSSGAPTVSGTPTLLTHANYTDGLHEIAIDTTGYAAGEYAVFCTLTISSVNPSGFCGSFVVRSTPLANSNATALLDLSNGIETGYTLRQALRIILSACSGKLSGAGTNTEVFRSATDAKDRITATVDASGNRTAIILDGT